MTAEELRAIANTETAQVEWKNDALRAAASEIERLAKFEQDSKRMDWFENRSFMAYRDRDCEFGTLVDHVTLVDEDGCRKRRSRVGIVKATLRECVDAAIGATEGVIQ